MAKTFDLSFDEALHGISYQNLMLYNLAMPGYDDEEDNAPEFDESKDANNPDNFASDEDEKVIRA